MSETPLPPSSSPSSPSSPPPDQNEPATGPVFGPPPGYAEQPTTYGPPQTVYVERSSRLTKVAAWVGIVSFLDTGPLFSVEAVVWTAVGGRATLIGPFVGAFLVRGLEFVLSGSWFADYWQFFIGALFTAVVLWIPDGIVGSIGNWLRKRRAGSVRQIREDADRRAHDQQRDWEPAGAPKPGEEVV